MQRPNLFKIATKELSHDAVITWLLQWAHPRSKEIDPELHECGRCFLKLFLDEVYQTKKLIGIDAERQWNHIDISAEINFEDDEKLLLVIENKTFADEHSDQFLRYKEIASKWADENDFRLACFYTKIGSLPLRYRRNIEAFTRSSQSHGGNNAGSESAKLLMPMFDIYSVSAR